MKKLILFCLILLRVAASGQGSGIQWNANPVSENVVNYHVWDHSGTTFTLMATVPQPVLPITLVVWYPTTFLPGSLHILSISAINSSGVEGLRDADLNFPIPSTPTGKKIVP